MKVFTQLLVAALAVVSLAIDAGPTFKLDAGIIDNSIIFVETTLDLPMLLITNSETSISGLAGTVCQVWFIPKLLVCPLRT
jgi:hypothetical protein